LELLACPACRRDLQLHNRSTEAERIASGDLRCAKCRRTYPIIGGIPRMVMPEGRIDSRQQRTREHFREEFTVEGTDWRDFDDPAVLEYLFFTRTGIDAEVYGRMPYGLYPVELPEARWYRPDGSALAGATVLDGGCGNGRFLRIAAEHAEHVVGLELGDHVELARARCGDVENVDLVQGSVLHPPFRKAAFDYVYSIGVLHHTVAPGRGALALANVVRAGGSMSIWVYPPSYWGNSVRRLTGKALHAWLCRKDPATVRRIASRWLYPLGRMQGRLAYRPLLKWLAAPAFAVNVPRHPSRRIMIATIMDYFASPVIHTHDYEQVRRWLVAAGVRRMDRLPVPTAWLAVEKR
jgi:uncharacterized protein YbaR (Trm112 family)